MKHLFLFLLFLSSCATIPPAGQQAVVGVPSYTSRADLSITIGGSTFDGVGSWKLTGPIQLVVQPPTGVALDRIQVTSCARSDVFQSVSAPFAYSYVPSPTELSTACPIYVEAFSKNALTAWGLVGFRTDETLPAHVYFNGQGISFAGFSTGQSKNGLEQEIDFKVPVRYSAEAGCHVATTDRKSFTFKPDAGFCRMSFGALGDDNKITWHRVLFLAYQQTLNR